MTRRASSHCHCCDFILNAIVKACKNLCFETSWYYGVNEVSCVQSRESVGTRPQLAMTE